MAPKIGKTSIFFEYGVEGGLQPTSSLRQTPQANPPQTLDNPQPGYRILGNIRHLMSKLQGKNPSYIAGCQIFMKV